MAKQFKKKKRFSKEETITIKLSCKERNISNKRWCDFL